MKFWAVIPAAGLGTRMNQPLPKQYALIRNKTVLEHSIVPFLASDLFEKIIIALHAEDEQWPRLVIAQHPKIIAIVGGAQRCLSVFNGLKILEKEARAEDWVLVHDAARPCLTQIELDYLVDNLKDEEVGGILALPMTNTLKYVEQKAIVSTLNRHQIWQALTPQMFRYGLLYKALQQSIETQNWVTDEAAALEYLGYRSKIIQGNQSNIKITEPMDLLLAEFYLSLI